MTPNQTVRAFCTECLGLPQYNRSEIENCQGDTCVGGCALFPYRLGKRIPVKTFRKFCIECMNGSAELIPTCPATKCKIYPFRMGKNPARQGQGASSEILQRAREQRKIRQNAAIRQESVPWQGQEVDRLELAVETPDKTNG